MHDQHTRRILYSSIKTYMGILRFFNEHFLHYNSDIYNMKLKLRYKDTNNQIFILNIGSETVIYENSGLEISFNDFLEQNNKFLEYEQYMIRNL